MKKLIVLMFISIPGFAVTPVQRTVQCVDAGSNDTYACTPAAALGAYVEGDVVKFHANTANTGTATLNISALGAVTIYKVAGGTTTVLSDNDIRKGQWSTLIYTDGAFQLVSQLGNTPGNCFSVNVSSGSGYQGLNEPIWTAPPESAVTITQIKATSLPVGTTVIYQLDEAVSAFDSAGTDVFSVAYSTANYTTVTTTSFANAGIAAGSSLVLNCPSSGAVAGSPRTLYLQICYRRDN